MQNNIYYMYHNYALFSFSLVPTFLKGRDKSLPYFCTLQPTMTVAYILYIFSKMLNELINVYILFLLDLCKYMFTQMAPINHLISLYHRHRHTFPSVLGTIRNRAWSLYCIAIIKKRQGERRGTQGKRMEEHEEEENNELCYTGLVIDRMCKTTITYVSHQDETQSLGDHSCVCPSITASSCFFLRLECETWQCFYFSIQATIFITFFLKHCICHLNLSQDPHCIHLRGVCVPSFSRNSLPQVLSDTFQKEKNN